MTLIELNVISDEEVPIVLNIDYIVSMQRSTKYTMLCMVSNDWYRIKETPEEIVDKIRASKQGDKG